MSEVPPGRIPVEGEPSFLSTADTAGIQMLCHVAVLRSGALDVTSVLVSSSEIGPVDREETSRKKLRERLDALARQYGLRFGPAPGAYVAARLRRAIETHAATAKVPLGPQAESALARLPKAEVEPAHPASALSPVRDAEARVAGSFSLHTEPELQRLLPPPHALEMMGQRVAAAASLAGASADADADAAAREQSVGDAMHAAIDEFYTPEERRRLATLLRDTALVFSTTRRPAKALDAVAVADAIESAGMFTTPVHRIPFVFWMFYKYSVLAGSRAEREAETA